MPRSPAPNGPPSRWPLAVPVVLSLAFSAAFIARSAFRAGGETHFSLFDDAMISMRYGRNLAEGHGLVWNPGEPAVEGYSNLLWTLFMAVVHLTGMPDATASLPVMVAGALLLAAGVALTGAIARRLAPDTLAPALLAMLMTALFFPLAFWTLRGMEVGLLVALNLAAVLLALRLGEGFSRREAGLLGAVLAAGLLVRDDFLVPAAIVAVYTVLAVPRERRWAAGGLLLVATAGVLAGHVGLRLALYGDPLPNTYYLKLGGIGLGARLARGGQVLAELGVVSLYAPLALAVVGGATARRRLRGPAPLLACLVAAQAAYMVYVGGDAWEWMGFADRYVAQVAPLLFVLAALGVTALLRAPPAVAARTAAALAVTFVAVYTVGDWGVTRERLLFFIPRGGNLHLLVGPAGLGLWFAALALVASRARRASRPERPPLAGTVAGVGTMALVLGALSLADLDSWGRDNAPLVDADAAMTRYGLALGATTRESASLAVVWAGAIPYFSRRPAVDLLGKSDPVVAHARSRHSAFGLTPGHTKWDYGHSIGRLRPDVIAQVWPPSRADLVAQVRRTGYDPWLLRVPPQLTSTADLATFPGGRVLVLRGTTRVRFERLERPQRGPRRPA